MEQTLIAIEIQSQHEYKNIDETNENKRAINSSIALALVHKHES